MSDDQLLLKGSEHENVIYQDFIVSMRCDAKHGNAILI